MSISPTQLLLVSFISLTLWIRIKTQNRQPITGIIKMTKQQEHLVWLGLVALAILGGSVFYFLCLSQSMMYFVNPTELLETMQNFFEIRGHGRKGSIHT